MLEDNKLSEVFGGWVIWIHEELQYDSLSCFQVRPIHLVHLLHLGNKRNEERKIPHAQKEVKQLNILKTYLYPLFRLIWLNRSV
jgi:hypothetical protein